MHLDTVKKMPGNKLCNFAIYVCFVQMINFVMFLSMFFESLAFQFYSSAPPPPPYFFPLPYPLIIMNSEYQLVREENPG